MDRGKMEAHDCEEEAFPWHLGVYDAHCHPTDTLASLDDLPGMKARVLTIMATRAQDQELVSLAAQRHGLYEEARLTGEMKDPSCRVIPSFGWHPWFSHQIFDDLQDSTRRHIDHVAHYKSVITPPPDDHTFIHALPPPRPLSEYLAETRSRLEQYPLALVGEIGLDRSFRIPDPSQPSLRPEPGMTPGSRDGRRLTAYRVDMAHQRLVLTAQLRLAGEMGRAVSVHGVAAHGVLFDALQSTWRGHERPVQSRRARKRHGSASNAHSLEASDSASAAQANGSALAVESLESDGGRAEEAGQAKTLKQYPPRICLHSYSGPVEGIGQYLQPAVPVQVYFSFSQIINFSTPAAAKTVRVIRAVPSDRLLVESDLHYAGSEMDSLLEGIVREMCRIKGWSLEDGTRQLANNWKQFVLGSKEDG